MNWDTNEWKDKSLDILLQKCERDFFDRFLSEFFTLISIKLLGTTLDVFHYQIFVWIYFTITLEHVFKSVWSLIVRSDDLW